MILSTCSRARPPIASRRKAKSRGETMRAARTFTASINDSQKNSEWPTMWPFSKIGWPRSSGSEARRKRGSRPVPGRTAAPRSAASRLSKVAVGMVRVDFLKLSPCRRTAQPPFGSRSRCHGPAVSATEAVCGSSRSARKARYSAVKMWTGRAGGVEEGSDDDERRGRRGGRVLVRRDKPAWRRE